MPRRDLPWRVEEICWDAFPSLKQVLVGDFLLRFALGVSRRANSANPLRAEPGDIPATIGAAEQLYRAQKQATIFRVPTIADPALDRELARRGYTSEGETCVLHGSIGRIAAAADPEVQLLTAPEPDWLAAMPSLQGHAADPQQREPGGDRDGADDPAVGRTLRGGMPLEEGHRDPRPFRAAAGWRRADGPGLWGRARPAALLRV